MQWHRCRVHCYGSGTAVHVQRGSENYVKVESYVQRASRTAVYENIDSRMSYIQTR